MAGEGQLSSETLSNERNERRALPESRGKGLSEIFLWLMITEVWEHVGFYDTLLDIAVIHLVPSLW